jgi:hypothetical protein
MFTRLRPELQVIGPYMRPLPARIEPHVLWQRLGLYRRVVPLEDTGPRRALGLVAFGTTNDTTKRGREKNEAPAHTEMQAGEDVPEWARRDSNARPLAPERRPDH